MTARPQIPGLKRDTPLSIFWRFVRFGALAWGGPAAQIAALKREYVDERGWLDSESFKRTLAVYQILPGPEATELCVLLGRLRAGRLAGMLAGIGFMLPGFALMLAFSALYVEADLAANLDELFYGLQAAVAAIIARAILRLGSSFITDVPLALIAAAALALTLLSPLSFVLVLLGGGLAYELWTRAGSAPARSHAFAPWPLGVALPAAAIALPLGLELLLAGLEAGVLTFGGAFTVIPFLEQIAVDEHGWVTQEQFVDGLAIGGVLPAPLVIFSTFVGYLTAGFGGALAITFGIFLPAILLPTLLHRQLVGLAENPRVRPLLLGVAAAVVGLIAAVAIEILETSVVDVPTALLALAAFATLVRFHSRLTVLWVVLGCGLLGAALQLTVI